MKLHSWLFKTRYWALGKWSVIGLILAGVPALAIAILPAATGTGEWYIGIVCIMVPFLLMGGIVALLMFGDWVSGQQEKADRDEREWDHVRRFNRTDDAEYEWLESRRLKSARK